MRPQHALDGRRLEQSLEHAAGAAVLQALVRRQRVLGPVPAVAELADVQRVRLLVLVLEVALEGVVAAEGAPAVGALLRLVDAPRRRRRHTYGGACNITGYRADGRRPRTITAPSCGSPTPKSVNSKIYREVTECKREGGERVAGYGPCGPSVWCLDELVLSVPCQTSRPEDFVYAIFVTTFVCVA